MATASANLIAALKASLADVAAEWSVAGYTRNETKEPVQEEIEGVLQPMTMEVVKVSHIVSLSSPLVRIAVGARAPLSMAYIGITEPDGTTYVDATIYIDGVAFDVVDSALHTQIMAMVATSQSGIDAAITASLELGPQTDADLDEAAA